MSLTFDYSDLLPDPKCEPPAARSVEDQKRAKYTSTDDTQNGNDHCGVAGNDLITGVEHTNKGGVTPGTWIDRIDSLC